MAYAGYFCLDIPDAVVALSERFRDDGVRECLVPAPILNAYGPPPLLTDDAV
jgi:hypothetical protein